MNTWLQFLARHGAQLADIDGLSEVLNFDSVSSTAPVSDYLAPITDLGLIAASGEDAAHFLHNQLTNDVEHLDMAHARLAGYCSPKGRLLATFLMWRSSDSIMLQLSRRIQPAVQKRLQMFVLRAKAKLLDATESHVMLGLGGAAAAAALSNWFPAPLPTEPFQKVDSDAGTLIRVADAAGVARYQWITTQQIAEDAWPTLTATLRPVGSHVWRLADIYAGIPQITQATQEHFVPQMINFEVIGGVNFRKGCYPGQEIVARSQYLGKLKRRMVLARIDASNVKPGTEIFSVSDAEQPCGMIVNAENVTSTETACLAEVKFAVLDAGTIHLGSVSGPILRFEPLPYPLTDPA